MNKRRTSLRLMTIMLTVVVTMQSCLAVKEYQKQRLNDTDMELSSRKIQKFETSFQSYREAASGANGGKTGGGCGCN